MVARQNLLIQPQINLEGGKISQSRKITIINKNPEILLGEYGYSTIYKQPSFIKKIILKLQSQ
jgi:hypothetical protein